jgi:hypothetical protein
MNDIGHRDVETYVRKLIFEEFKSCLDAATGRYQVKRHKVRKSSKPTPENPTANIKYNRIPQKAGKR